MRNNITNRQNDTIVTCAASGDDSLSHSGPPHPPHPLYATVNLKLLLDTRVQTLAHS